jgi:hypothetical protein
MLMKKIFCVATLFPSLLIATSVVFASSNASVVLSDYSDTVNQIVQDQKDSHVKPGVKPVKPGHPVKPKPKPKPPVVKPPKPKPPVVKPPVKPPVDTKPAYRAGVRAGSEEGRRKGKREGYSAGERQGEREGRLKGYREGDSAGLRAGKRDGWGVDQSAGTLKGSREGQNTGTNNGTRAGERRCYDEGYASSYNVAYADAKELGLQDSASYSSGYANGQAAASVIEVENGQKAGYQVGFSQRENELQNSFPDMAMKGVFSKSGLNLDTMGFSIEMARKGYSTPEERRAYDKGYKEGYRNTYRRAYDDAKRDGYRNKYQRAYRRAYDNQYSISYRRGYTEGREEGYQEAYSEAYNSAYSAYFYDYKNREYSGQRADGQRTGQEVGQREGFADGCAVQTKRGYNEGYAKTSAEVYPGAFEAGKQSGIDAADRYYQSNSVLKVFDVEFYDENQNGKFEASENIMMKADVRNFGFQSSSNLTIVVTSERGEIVLAADLSAEGVAGRTNAMLNLNIGKLYDVVAPDSDALFVTFTEKGNVVGDFRQVYARTNDNKVGIAAKDKTTVTKKATWFFPGTVTKLDRGEKVLITGDKKDYFKVNRAELGKGDWSKGYVKKDKLNLQ